MIPRISPRITPKEGAEAKKETTDHPPAPAQEPETATVPPTPVPAMPSSCPATAQGSNLALETATVPPTPASSSCETTANSPYPEGWYIQTNSQETAICHTCFSQKPGAFIVSEKSVTCLSCAVEKFSRKAFMQLRLPSNLTADALGEIFEYSAPPLMKIGMFFNREKLIQYLNTITQADASAGNKILENIVLQMGYNIDHPLSLLFRAIALTHLMQSKTYYVPTLLALEAVHRTRTFPETFDLQRFRYNLAHILGSLAPGKPAVQQLIAEVIQEAKKRGEFYVNTWFHRSASGHYTTYENLALSNPDLEKTVAVYMLPIKIVEPINMITPFHIETLINSLYTANQLKILYTNFLGTLHRDTGIALPFRWPEKQAKKAHYIRLFSEILMDKTLMQAFLQKFPSRLAQVFLKMVWEHKGFALQDVASLGSVNLQKSNRRYAYGQVPNIPAKLQLFQVRDNRSNYWEQVDPTLYIDHSFAEILKKVLPIPEFGVLHFTKTPSEDLLISTNQDILLQLPYLTTYIDQVGIKRSKNGTKILKSSLKEAGKLCSLNEPYPYIPGADTIRTTMILQLLEGIPPTEREHNPSIAPEQYLKEIFTRFFPVDNTGSHIFVHFLDYLKSDFGTGELAYIARNSKQNWTHLQNFLKLLVIGSWVTIEEMLNYLLAHSIYPYPFDLSLFSINYVNFYFNSLSTSQYASGYDKLMLHESNLRETLLLPYLKTLIFVLNTLGIVDIAYDIPANPCYQNKNNTWLSLYDGIAEVSLTPLGAWLIGKTDELETLREKSAIRINLDSGRLLITVEGADPLVELTLSKIAVSIGSGYYQVRADLFLKECADSADIENSIEMFRANICQNPPPVWEEFFSSLLHKAFPLKLSADQHFMFSLDPGNTELIQLIFNDSYLRKYIVRAEDYQIFIKPENYRSVQKRLAEFGFLLPDRKRLGSDTILH